MLVLTFLGGLVVVRHHLQLTIGTNFLGKRGQLNGFSGAIGAAACHDGDAPCRLFNRHADDFTILSHAHGGRFARGSNHTDAVGALCNMPFHQFSQTRVIDAAIGQHGGDHGNNAAGDGARWKGHISEV